MLHACAARFDVTGNLEKFYELNKALVQFAKSCEKRHCSTFVFI